MIKQLIIFLFLTCACIHLQAQVNFISTIAGDDTAGFRGDGGPATAARFDHANLLWLDNFNNLYISDAFNNRVRKIVLSTGIITTVAGNGTPGYAGDGGQATDAALFIPDGVCTDSLGNIYIADGLNHCIRKVLIQTGIINTIVGNGIAGNSGDGGLAINAKITSPSGLMVDKLGNLYFADIDNNNIRKLTLSGIITTIAGNGILGYSGDGGPATDAEFSTPSDIGIDSYGNIYITDGYNNVLREVNATTGIVTTIAGNGTAGYSGDGGLAINSTENYPYGIFVSKEDDIFFVDNEVIRKIDGNTGIINTVVGCGIGGFSGDGGPALNAKLKPDGVVLDNYGTMYITDYRNNRIRKVYNPKLGINPIEPSREPVILYPNPTKDEVTIAYMLAGNEDVMFQITDITGRLIRAKELSGQKQEEVMNLKDLAQGLYLYKVVQGDIFIAAGKIIKE